MSDRYVMEALLRPAVELNTAVAAGCAAFVCVSAPWAVALAPSVSYVTAGAFVALAAVRTRQGLRILRYRLKRGELFKIDLQLIQDNQKRHNGELFKIKSAVV